jgi:hypothetical protein
MGVQDDVKRLTRELEQSKIRIKELESFCSRITKGDIPINLIRMIMEPTEGFPDDNYKSDPWKPAYEWSGGEKKFGKWRMYFNTHEKSWIITYNCPFNVATNKFGPRDSGDSRAGICMLFGVNVAEGAVGSNTFGISFAPWGEAGTVPDFNAGAHYWFFDGVWSGAGTHDPVPACMYVRGASGMGARVGFLGNDTTGNPSFWSFGAEVNGDITIRRILDKFGNFQNRPTYSEPFFRIDRDGNVYAKDFIKQQEGG